MKEKRMDVNFRKRLQRRLHYGDMANLDVPSLPLTELAVDCFHDRIPEKLGHVDLYSASSVIRRNHVSPCSVVLSMLYAKRLRQQEQRNTTLLQTMSSADVFFISMMVASKYLYDEGVEEEVFNDVWADNTDQDVDDVNQMEIDFLQAMDWNLFVRPLEFEETLAAIERRLALQEGFKRGWYTYTEMDLLMSSDLMWALWTNVGSECSKMLTAISAAYLTSFLSMMGSTALAVHISGHLSSVAVGLLTLQSSPLMHAVSTGLPSSVPALSSNLGSMSDSLTYGHAFEINQSEMASQDTSPPAWALDDNWHVKPNPPQKSGSQTTAAGGNGLRPPEEDSDRRRGPSAEPTTSSLWSLWFFDSLMSQLWAVLCMKSRLAHCVGWSATSSKMLSPKEPDRFGDTAEGERLPDTQTPRFRRQQRNHVTVEPPTRTVRSRQSTTADKACMSGGTRLPAQEDRNPDETPSLAHMYSDSSLHFEIWSYQASAAVHLNHGPPGHQQRPPPDFPRRLNPSNSAPDHKSYIDHPSRIVHTSHPERNNPQRRQYITEGPLYMQPTKDTSSHCQISQHLQTGLLDIPIGFVTSIYQTIMVT